MSALNRIFKIPRRSHSRPQPTPPASPPPPPPPPPPEPSPPTWGGGRILQVTDASDGVILNRGYSYWSQAFIRDTAAFVFAPHASNRPPFFKVDLVSGSVERLGPLIGYIGEGGDWSWTPDGKVMVPEGPRLHRIDPFNGPDDIAMDISDLHPGSRIWQPHTSDDGRTHSATVERIVDDGPYPRLGTVVFRNGQPWHFFGAEGILDESHLSGNGDWLVIEERRDDPGNDNRIVDLRTATSHWVTDRLGALSHCATGPDFIVGEDNFAGACVRLDLPSGGRMPLFQTWGMGHVSVRAGRCLLSDRDQLALVNLAGAGVVSVANHGMVGSGYDYQVFANLDHSGRVAAFVSNRGIDRMDLYLLIL